MNQLFPIAICLGGLFLLISGLRGLSSPLGDEESLAPAYRRFPKQFGGGYFGWEGGGFGWGGWGDWEPQHFKKAEKSKWNKGWAWKAKLEKKKPKNGRPFLIDFRHRVPHHSLHPWEFEWK